MTERAPVNVKICMGSACFARGNGTNLEYIERFIQQHGAAINVELCGARCENKCAYGPHVTIDGKAYNNVTPDLLKAVLTKKLQG